VVSEKEKEIPTEIDASADDMCMMDMFDESRAVVDAPQTVAVCQYLLDGWIFSMSLRLLL
jgi:hypothetical protein